jgi:adenine-specific DNA glycosylase
VCTHKSPKCGECPIQKHCNAYKEVNSKQALKRPHDNLFVVPSSSSSSSAPASASASADTDADNSVTNAQEEKKKKKGGSRRRVEVKYDDEEHRHAACDICREDLAGVDRATVQWLPMPKKKKPPLQCYYTVVYLQRAGVAAAEVLLVQRPEGGLLSGLWEFPHIERAQDDKQDTQLDQIDEWLTAQGFVSQPLKRTEYSEEEARFLPQVSDDVANSDDEDEDEGVIAYRGEISHVFSHRVHNMSVFHARIGAEGVASREKEEEKDGDNEDSVVGDGTANMKWASHVDMKASGLTTGNKKVLAMCTGVKKEKKTATRKRKKNDSAKKGPATQHNSISKFFATTKKQKV